MYTYVYGTIQIRFGGTVWSCCGSAGYEDSLFDQKHEVKQNERRAAGKQKRSSKYTIQGGEDS